MGKLENLHVERTDGVDRPATGRTWVIVKNADQPVEKDYPALSRAALTALLKEEGLALGDESFEALKALADALEIDFPVEKAEAVEETPEAEAVEPEPTEKTEGDDAPITRGELAGLVKDAMAAAIAEEMDSLDEGTSLDEPVQKATSKQPKGPETEIVKGKGLYEDVIFNQ